MDFIPISDIDNNVKMKDYTQNKRHQLRIVAVIVSGTEMLPAMSFRFQAATFKGNVVEIPERKSA